MSEVKKQVKLVQMPQHIQKITKPEKNGFLPSIFLDLAVKKGLLWKEPKVFYASSTCAKH